jgi:hypothetical protein
VGVLCIFGRAIFVLRLRKVVGERSLKEWWRRRVIYLVGGLG